LSRRLLLPCLALLAALAIACSGDKKDAPSPTPSVTSGAAATTAPEATATTAPPATSPTPRPLADLPAPDPIQWTACDDFYQCAEFEVPIDYTDPDRGNFTLALIRLPAANPAARIGSLFINPGGPGGSAIDYLKAVAFAIPSQIKQQFDLVAFDPRGVGHSDPIVCGEDIQAMLALNPDPETDAEWQSIVDTTKSFVDLCVERAGDTLPYYGTLSVARDMDRIRQGLGEDQLNYLGFSYGTSIGQVYADLFPRNFRAMVLDGALDNSLSADERNLEQILAFEAALNRFMDYCRDTVCFSVDPQDAVQTLLDRTDAAPIPAPSADRPLTQGDLVWGILGSLYARFQWAGLANAISDALDGDGSRMIRLVDQLWERNDDGSYSNLFEANIAVNCLDQVVDRDPDHHRMLSQEFADQAPIFGSWGGYLNLPCAYWPPDPTPPPVPTAAGAPPILIIGNTGDPATPLKWSTALSHQLESAVLLTNDAEGHTGYLQLSNCVDGIVDAYLLQLEVPDEGTTCGNAGITPVPPVP
jgi:pimeloyl-ACP methyl ester carboxylesterase